MRSLQHRSVSLQVYKDYCEPTESESWGNCLDSPLKLMQPEDTVDESSLLFSDEPRSLCTFPSRSFTETMEIPNHSQDRSVSPLSQAFTTYYNRGPGEQGEAAPAYTFIDHQLQREVGVCHEDHDSHFRSDNYIHRLWMWEILSIAMAALALVAIVITLVLHKDRSLPKWPSAITINALIAVFTAVFKACLMMPIAEGIGQLKWLWYQKSRPLRRIEHWDLASRGRSSHLRSYRPHNNPLHSFICLSEVRLHAGNQVHGVAYSCSWC